MYEWVDEADEQYQRDAYKAEKFQEWLFDNQEWLFEKFSEKMKLEESVALENMTDKQVEEFEEFARSLYEPD